MFRMHHKPIYGMTQTCSFAWIACTSTRV